MSYTSTMRRMNKLRIFFFMFMKIITDMLTNIEKFYLCKLYYHVMGRIELKYSETLTLE